MCVLAQIAVASDRLSKHEGKAQSLWKTTGSRAESDRNSVKYRVMKQSRTAMNFRILTVTK